jgi:hypothetical protein
MLETEPHVSLNVGLFHTDCPDQVTSEPIDELDAFDTVALVTTWLSVGCEPVHTGGDNLVGTIVPLWPHLGTCLLAISFLLALERARFKLGARRSLFPATARIVKRLKGTMRMLFVRLPTDAHEALRKYAKTQGVSPATALWLLARPELVERGRGEAVVSADGPTQRGTPARERERGAATTPPLTSRSTAAGARNGPDRAPASRPRGTRHPSTAAARGSESPD